MSERAIKWSYMDHWRSNGPAGPVDQWHSRKTMSAFLKQIKATGFDAIDTFDFRIWQMYGDYGGAAKYQEMVQDHGLERIVSTFHAADYDVRNYAPHISETHEFVLEDFRVTMGRWGIWHVQIKDALAVDDAEEYLQPHAHWTVRVRGGAREIPRWFAEPGADGGLVDVAAVTRALLDAGYDGWIVVESDQSPHPAASALLAGYLVQRELRPLVEKEAA